MRIAAYQEEIRERNRSRRESVTRYVRIMESFGIGEPDPRRLRDIGNAIYTDSKITGLTPEFYLALIRVENPWLDPEIQNGYGAVGLTQVVPRYWQDVFPECGTNLTEIYTQVCYGGRIFMHYLNTWDGNEVLALYAYNGCTASRREAMQRCVDYPHRIKNYEATHTQDF
jgi:soluble lytic murein transglycosylase-like protein